MRKNFKCYGDESLNILGTLVYLFFEEYIFYFMSVYFHLEAPLMSTVGAVQVMSRRQLLMQRESRKYYKNDRCDVMNKCLLTF